MTTGIIVPAHMHSTRFPEKPLADVGGRPLLSYAVQAAKDSGMPFRVASSDWPIAIWCDENDVPHSSTSECRNGTERAAMVNLVEKWDRVIVLQCDEPDVTGRDLQLLAEKNAPSTMACNMSDGDWDNQNSVVITAKGWPVYAAEFIRGVKTADVAYFRHIGVYLYDALMLSEYLEHGPTPREESKSLEQLRTMALGYAWSVMFMHHKRRFRSVNVPEDVKQFTEDGNTVSRPA